MKTSLRHRASARTVLTSLAAGVCAAFAMSATPASAGCPPQPWPQQSCREFDRSSLAIDSYGHFEWRGSHGASAGAEDLGDPSALYRVCAWDEDHLVVAADIQPGVECPGGSCWTAAETPTLTYKDEAGANGDIRLLEFNASDESRTKLHAQVMVIGGINLPVTGGVIVQLVRNGGDACFESFLPADSFTLDDRADLVAKFDVDAAVAAP